MNTDTKPGPSNAAMSGRVAMIALLVLAALGGSDDLDCRITIAMKTLFTNARLIDPENGTDRIGALQDRRRGYQRRSYMTTHPPTMPKWSIAAASASPPGSSISGSRSANPASGTRKAIKSAGLAAAAGGITTMVTRPDTDLPATDSPETLEFVARRANEAAPVNVLPMAALTKGRAGREMTEIGFLLDAGAVAFTDCDHVVTDTKVFSRALTYARSLGALVIAHPQEPIAERRRGRHHPASSPRYAACLLSHLWPNAWDWIARPRAAGNDRCALSYRTKSPRLVRCRALERAKANGLDVTAGTSIHHLTLNALDVADYRSFFKLKPPLRDPKMTALRWLTRWRDGHH